MNYNYLVHAPTGSALRLDVKSGFGYNAPVRDAWLDSIGCEMADVELIADAMPSNNGWSSRLRTLDEIGFGRKRQISTSVFIFEGGGGDKVKTAKNCKPQLPFPLTQSDKNGQTP